ncbi:D-alanyl-D-alanine carboxypeptidase family protein [Hyphomicrobium sp.]|uniref:D-alanyl-D-alanine carboxypeptidase family protein n=1 Tax=Hyphomicrobium sp. TaxID=82 RepID=UPI002E351564|nr:D-alanyl-D-alanine carboxypeptidase family protein [Hyphomicrobium sp.]HEX2841659.1 D-alanyl-D-alanine carboxypeptidase family protein [Hyphomicrobium sp.]
MRARWFSVALSALTLLAGEHAIAGGPALVFDPSDGKVLYAEDADDHWHPASLTKIMTAYLTFEALKTGKLKLDQRIPYSERAQGEPPSKLGLHVGATLTIDQSLKALIIKSANDVAIVLAEAISGSPAEFVAHMNQTARVLGMSRTQFVNPNGLPAPEQVTTARDLAKLARAVVRDYPEYISYWSMFDARIGKIHIGTHNGLLRTFEGADGMKTGFICDSGFNVVASATRDGRQIMAVVLGEATGGQRTIRAASLLEHGFQSYGWKALFNHSQSLDTMPIATDAKDVMSVRKDVRSFECGTGRRKSPTAKKRVKKPAQSADGAAQEEPVKAPAPGVTKIAADPSEAPKKRPPKPAQAATIP